MIWNLENGFFHFDIEDVIEPITVSVRYARKLFGFKGEETTKAKHEKEDTTKWNEAIIKNARHSISRLIPAFSKMFNAMSKSQFLLRLDSNSPKTFLKNIKLPVTIHGNSLMCADNYKKFYKKGNFFGLMTIFKFLVEALDQVDKKFLLDYLDKRRFVVRRVGKKT